MRTELLEHLEQLLAAEKLALMTANYDALAPLELQKSDLLQALSKETNSKKALRKIRDQIDANQALLAAAISGIGAARKRFDALNNVQNNLTVYDQSGQMNVVPARNSAFEKKA